jgi:hypothetical protein
VIVLEFALGDRAPRFVFAVVLFVYGDMNRSVPSVPAAF